jgi:mannose-6-phosphate isomerase-like protein (cupin superfamily)
MVYIESIAGQGRYEIKRLKLAPFTASSLGQHQTHSQHWVIVQGVARVTRGVHVFELHENESVFIPRLVRHRLENPGAGPLEIIEVRVHAPLEEATPRRGQHVAGQP